MPMAKGDNVGYRCVWCGKYMIANLEPGDHVTCPYCGMKHEIIERTEEDDQRVLADFLYETFGWSISPDQEGG